MNKKVRSENVAQRIKHWKNPLASKVASRRLFKNTLANDFIRLRRLARQCHKIRDHPGCENVNVVHLREKVLNNEKKNGSYFWVDTVETARPYSRPSFAIIVNNISKANQTQIKRTVCIFLHHPR